MKASAASFGFRYDYAQRRLHAGVAVEVHVYPGAPHGFDLLLPGTGVANRGRADLDDWLGRALALRHRSGDPNRP